MVRLIIFIIVGVLVLSFFGVSIRAIVESPIGQDNVHFVVDLFQNIWEFIKHIWENIVDWFSAMTAPLKFPG